MPGLKLIPLEYPGRGARIREPLIRDIDIMVDDILIKMKGLLRNQPYAVYGHSMGGLVAFMLCRKIIMEKGMNPPLHLFISGTMGPSAHAKDNINRHLMPAKEFMEEIRRLDGCPEEILESEELLNYFAPILRADFEASETFIYNPGSPLDIPVTVITGDEENMEDQDIAAWQEITSYAVDFRKMKGKHFFILKYPREIINIITEKLFSKLNA